MEAWRLNRTGSSGPNNWTFFSVNARHLWTRGICRSWLLLFDKLVRNNNRREAASSETRDPAPNGFTPWLAREKGWSGDKLAPTNDLDGLAKRGFVSSLHCTRERIAVTVVVDPPLEWLAIQSSWCLGRFSEWNYSNRSDFFRESKDLRHPLIIESPHEACPQA